MGDLVDSAEKEYRAWASYQVISQCLVDEKDISDDEISNYTGPWEEDLKVSINDVIFTHTGNTAADCDQADDMDSFVRGVGFDSIGDLQKNMYNTTFEAKRDYDGENYPRRARTIEGALEGIKTRMQEKGLFGVDGSFNLSGSAQYWALNTIYRASESRGGCEGFLTNDSNKTVGHDQDLWANDGPYYNVDESGTLRTYGFAIYENDGEVVLIDIPGAPTPNGIATCDYVASRLGPQLASDLSQRLASAVQECQQSGGTNCTEQVADINEGISGSDGQGQTCEESDDSKLGWLMCPMIGAVEDTINFIFDFVDSMLNIDAQQLYDDEELRTAWSYFRAISTFLLLAVGLVMIISQAMGGGN